MINFNASINKSDETGHSCLNLYLFFKICLFLLESLIYKEERHKDLPTDDPLPKWPQQPELSCPQARRQEPAASSRSPERVQGPKALGHVCFPRPHVRSRKGSGTTGIRTRTMWDPGACKARTLTSRLSQWVLKHLIFQMSYWLYIYILKSLGKDIGFLHSTSWFCYHIKHEEKHLPFQLHSN